jgi:hypothetical protein
MKIGSYKSGLHITLNVDEFPNKFKKGCRLEHSPTAGTISLIQDPNGTKAKKRGNQRIFNFNNNTAKKLPNFPSTDVSDTWQQVGPDTLVITLPKVKHEKGAPVTGAAREKLDERVAAAPAMDLFSMPKVDDFTKEEIVSFSVDNLNMLKEQHGEHLNFDIDDTTGKLKVRIEY